MAKRVVIPLLIRSIGSIITMEMDCGQIAVVIPLLIRSIGSPSPPPLLQSSSARSRNPFVDQVYRFYADSDFSMDEGTPSS